MLSTLSIHWPKPMALARKLKKKIIFFIWIGFLPVTRLMMFFSNHSY
jgi:hypothetical protein